MQLDKITSEHVSDYSTQRESEGLSIGTINRELRVLRRILRLAVEWNVLEKSPKVAMAGNEPFRVRVVGDAEFNCYLLHASPLLADVAAILNDTGFRPDELHRLGWADITFVNGRNGALSVRYGKTEAARRTLPMTPRVRCILEARWLSAGKPASGWVFPVKASKSDHITPQQPEESPCEGTQTEQGRTVCDLQPTARVRDSPCHVSGHGRMDLV
jgi:integrase